MPGSTTEETSLGPEGAQLLVQPGVQGQAARHHLKARQQHPTVAATAYFLPNGGTAAPADFPLPVLRPMTRPEASRFVPVIVPAPLPLLVWLPVKRPDASRKSVRLPLGLVRVVAVPETRPLASRWVVREEPPEEPFVMADPVMRPEASRYVVRVCPPGLVWLVEVPNILPDASRTIARSMLPPPFCRSMVCTTRPEASRTT
jgi:hypothetical protein